LIDGPSALGSRAFAPASGRWHENSHALAPAPRWNIGPKSGLRFVEKSEASANGKIARSRATGRAAI
jgi:hypothetical protein